MPRKYVKKETYWSNRALADAITERTQIGTSFEKLSSKYKIPVGTLYRHIKKHKLGIPHALERRGKKPTFTSDEINDLKECVVSLASLGFAPSIRDLGSLVQNYAVESNVESALKVFNYKGCKGFPGPDWTQKFLHDNNLSLKEATKLSITRHNATRNPYIVYHFYDLLEKTINDLEIGNRPDLIWNLDESGLPSEPGQCKVISLKGQKTCQIVTGADRENTTVLASCSASGKALPPLIIYKGMNVQTSWRPNLPRDHPNYPWLYANKSGWMEAEIFYKWFKIFEEKTRSYKDGSDELEPRLVIYDGHLSHVWWGTLELAREKNVTIIKLPPHTTELLQPLDVAVFKSLKSSWGRILFDRLKTTRQRLTKAEFAELVAREDVWGKGLSQENIISGFRKSGIFPPNRNQYPENRFSPQILEKYKKWVEDGKPELSHEQLQELNGADTEQEEPILNTTTDNPEKTVHDGRVGKFVTFFIPDDTPGDMIRVEPNTSSNGSIPSSSRSPLNFKEMALKILDKTPPNTEKKAPCKRRKVNPYGDIVTSDEHFEKAIELAEAKEKKTKAKPGPSNKGKKPRKQQLDEDSSDYEIIEEDSDSIVLSESDEEDEIVMKKYMFPPTSERQTTLYLIDLWKNINPPVNEDSLLNTWFAGIYYPDPNKKKKPKLFMGKVLKRFLADANGPATHLQLDCLRPAVSKSTTELQELPSHLPRDIGLFEISNIIAGPFGGDFRNNGTWSFEEYPLVVKTFDMCVKIDREEIYETKIRQK